MPPNRRHRPSLPTSPGADDISGLSLSECRDRLARNERVLNSSLFSSVSPPPSLSTSPTSPFLGDQSTFHAFGSAASASASAGPSRPPAPPVDPVKEKLLLTRQALLQREQELMMAQSTDQVAKLEVGSPESPRFMDTMSAGRRVSGSGGGGSAAGASRSGKARAMEIIRQGEANRSPNAIILPVDETIQLAERDFDNQTAQSFSSLSLHRPFGSSSSRRSQGPGTPTKSSSRNRAPIDPLDENARALHLGRLNAFMSYKGDPSFDDNENEDEDVFGLDFDNPDAEGEEGEYADERMGSGLVDGYGVKRERGTGEEVDEYGEDDERWIEGNDEYEGMGGVGPGTEGGLERVR